MGNLVKEISPRGAETSYTYDKHDELTSITDPKGNVTSYTVDLNRQVTELTQKNGGTYRYTYDAVHRLTGITTPLGLEKEFTYDPADNLVQETDSLGRTTIYAYDIMHRMTEAVNAKDGKTTFGYDIRGNRNAVTDAMGYTWNYQYDLVDQLTKGTDPEGKATEAVYDLVGNITSITRPGDRTTRYTYDRNYNQTTLTDPKGYVYRSVYDSDNRLVGTADPLQQTESITYDAGSRVTAVRDKMELTESYTHDAHGNVTTRKATDGLVTRYSYDLLDNLVAVTDPMNRRTSYSYDSMGNITTVTDAKLHVTTYTYDLENNLTSRTTPMGRTEEYVRDAAGRLTQRITPSGNAIHYDYDTLNGLVEKTYHNTGELGNDHPVQMGYNEMGQRISMEDITGESSYTYDGLGRLKTATNGSGKTVTYQYDEADNLGAVIYPDGKSVRYEYDKNDNITKLTDRDGRETVFSYDPINRLTKVVRADGSESVYTYNARNQVLSVENTCACGFLISSYRYTYGDSGLVTKEVAKECLFTSEKDYGHKGGSREECAHVPANPWENQNPVWETTTRLFTYDDNGQLLGCDESKGQFNKTTYTYTYDEAGNRTFAKKEKLYSYLESWQATYTYNDDNQMVSAKKREGNLTKTYTFQYDANGNMTRECFRNCAEVTYQYDTENRLAAVYDQQKLRMAAVYDGDGNRAFQLNYNPEARCGYGMNVSGEIFMPEHSTEEDGSLTAEGQLFSYICSKTGRAYDLTEYVNDTNRPYTEVLTAYNINSGTDRESYTYAGEMRVSKNRFWNEARDLDHDQMGYYLYDGRGSVTANTWYNGMVTAAYQYDPYGQLEHGSTKHTDFYGYNGESYNPNTGLVYLRARYYNAEQGRFFQEDTYAGTVTDPLTQNRYAYVKNSPLNYTDPSGHKIPSIWEVISSVENKRREFYGRVDDYIWGKITGGIKEMMNTAQEFSRNMDCELGTAVYNIVLGMGFAFFDNTVLQAETLIAKGLNPYWNSSDSQRYRQEIEDWVIENGVTDTTYFYLGQVISDALQVLIVMKQLPKIISRLGPALARLSAVLCGAGGGPQLAAAGVGNLALEAGMSVGTANALIGTIGVVGAGVAIVFMDVSGIGHDADKFVEALTEGRGKPDHMIGENGTQTSSKTTWQKGKTERIDVENPAPGERPGQIHYHDSNNNKWYYDIDGNYFYDQKTGSSAPKSVQKLLDDKSFVKGIKKALEILGE